MRSTITDPTFWQKIFLYGVLLWLWQQNRGWGGGWGGSYRVKPAYVSILSHVKVTLDEAGAKWIKCKWNYPACISILSRAGWFNATVDRVLNRIRDKDKRLNETLRAATAKSTSFQLSDKFKLCAAGIVTHPLQHLSCC